MSASAKWDICIEQGATWQKIVEFQDAAGAPVDVSAWTFRGQVRAYYDSPDVLATFVFTAGPATNKKVITLSAAVTGAIPVPPSGKAPARKSAVYIYDMDADLPDGTTDRIFEGSATVSAEVTKP